MFKKRYLPILSVLLLVIGIIVLFGIEWHRAYVACRDKLATRYGHVVSEYQYTRFHLPPDTPITMLFDNEIGGSWCYVHRHGLKWEVNAIIEANPPR